MAQILKQQNSLRNLYPSVSSRCKISFVKSINTASSIAKRKPITLFSSVESNAGTLSNNSFCITTPIYYVNGQPHLGHAYTSVISDVLARYARKQGKPVYFLTGTDEHGQKVQQSAATVGKTPQQLADDVSIQFQKLVIELNCTNDDFIRTTDARHKTAVASLWKKLKDHDQIYLGAYEGWYSIRDEAFYSDDELVDGKAPTGAPVEWVKEESYFFRLSQWTEKLLEFYDKTPDFIAPKGRRNEVISFVKQEGGLKDLSISRTTFSWGIPVPDDPAHVVYVWLDALTNYISALGYPNELDPRYQKFWPASLHIVGKDILRFHAVFWPAFLMAAELPTPKRIFAHGWWTKDGEKMSKSIGNVLDPFELIEKYSVDYLRYYLSSEITFGSDGDFSHELFCNRVNGDLANDLGNLAQRVLTLINKHCEAKVPSPTGSDSILIPSIHDENIFTVDDRNLLKLIKDALPTIVNHLEEQNMKAVCETVILLSRAGNKYIDVQAPWVLLKANKNRFQTVLYVLAELIRTCGVLLEPIMPRSCGEMLDQLGVSPSLRSFESLSESQMISPFTSLGSAPKPIFPKLDVNVNNNNTESSPKKSKNDESRDLIEKLKEKYKDQSIEDLSLKVTEIGNLIRKLKSEKKVTKEEINAYITELNYLKERCEPAKNFLGTL